MTPTPATLPVDFVGLASYVGEVTTEFPVIIIPIILILTGAVLALVARLSKKAGR